MSKTNKVKKKPYEKPQLRVVSIAPGVQTLGIGCKLAASGIRGLGGANPCILGSPCASTQGS